MNLALAVLLALPGMACMRPAVIEGDFIPAPQPNEKLDVTGVLPLLDDLIPFEYRWMSDAKPVTIRWVRIPTMEVKNCVVWGNEPCKRGKEEFIELGLRSDGVVIWR